MSISVAVIIELCLLLAADKPGADPVKAEWQRLEGTWTLTKLEIAGHSLLEEGKPLPKIVIKDGKITGLNGAPTEAGNSSNLKLDPTQKPKTIDIRNFKGGDPAKGVTLIGIYELAGDEFRVCVEGVETAKLNERAKDRPKAFDSKQGALGVFRREK